MIALAIPLAILGVMASALPYYEIYTIEYVFHCS